eukprot:9012053-Alexandrium_andersonii.AAC.1
MSASLVGSEMCIRDSACCLCCAPRVLLALPELLPLLLSPLPGTHRRPAVSYTHLTLPTICSV